MEDFLNFLCGKSDYMILRCQKNSKEELRKILIEYLAKDKKK